MENDIITFELATHFLPKVALRLESLYQTIKQACLETHPVIHHYAVNHLIEMIKIIEKPELKSRFLKEFVRIEHSEHKNETQRSQKLYHELHDVLAYLSQFSGLFGETIHHDAFLQSLRYSQAQHQTDCEAFSPQLLVWLQSSPSQRQKRLNQWLAQFNPLKNTVGIYLHVLRSTALFKPIDLSHGFHQHPLPQRANCQMLVLRMQKNDALFPRMQLGHHGLSIRLFDEMHLKEVRHTDVAFELGVCQF